MVSQIGEVWQVLLVHNFNRGASAPLFKEWKMKSLLLALLFISGVAYSQATTYTTNYRYAKPGDTSNSWGSEFRSNFDQLDAQLKTFENSLALYTKYTKTFADFSTAATTNEITLFVAPAGAVIDTVIVNHTAAFTGGAISAYTVSVQNGTLNSAVDVFTAPTDTATGTSNDKVLSFASPTAVTATATSTGANLSEATTGSVDIYVRYSLLP